LIYAHTAMLVLRNVDHPYAVRDDSTGSAEAMLSASAMGSYSRSDRSPLDLIVAVLARHLYVLIALRARSAASLDLTAAMAADPGPTAPPAPSGILIQARAAEHSVAMLKAGLGLL
jgi:hypothetical protein